MNKTPGWIALPRNLQHIWIWDEPRKLQMWISMVFMANWEPQVTICGDRQVTITRGQFSTSTRMLAAKLGCSRQTLFTFLDHLESTGMIRRENIANRFSIITIVDYEKTYQPLSVKRSQKQDKKIEEKPFENDVADDGRKPIQSDGADRRLDRKLDHIKKEVVSTFVNCEFF